MVRSRPLNAADQSLWAAYAKTLSRLLPGRQLPVAALVAPSPTAPAKVTGASPLAVRPAPVPLAEVTPFAAPAGLDTSTWARFSSARLRAAQTLDLHGMTATRAHGATVAFIERAAMDGVRCVEIITGRGEVLVRELPLWLNAPGLRPLILAIAHPPAHRAFNLGSTRILIRRRRDPVR